MPNIPVILAVCRYQCRIQNIRRILGLNTKVNRKIRKWLENTINEYKKAPG
jgi:hypothetical protein